MTVYVHQFVDLVPLSREDGVPWNRIEIAQAPDASGVPGAWTSIETQALTPLDTDPRFPMPRDVSTTAATMEDAWYRFRWLDVAGAVSRWTDPTFTGASDGTRPSVGDVAALLRARTKITGGSEEGTFSGRTRPTHDEVDALIDEAHDEVLGKVQAPDAGTAYERRVRGAIRLYTAMLVELSYFPEQVGADRSPYASYAALYKSRIDALIAEGESGEVQGTGEGAGADGSANAAWYFPADDGGLVGWGSNWLYDDEAGRRRWA